MSRHPSTTSTRTSTAPSASPTSSRGTKPPIIATAATPPPTEDGALRRRLGRAHHPDHGLADLRAPVQPNSARSGSANRRRSWICTRSTSWPSRSRSGGRTCISTTCRSIASGEGSDETPSPIGSARVDSARRGDGEAGPRARHTPAPARPGRRGSGGLTTRAVVRAPERLLATADSDPPLRRPRATSRARAARSGSASRPMRRRGLPCRAGRRSLSARRRRRATTSTVKFSGYMSAALRLSAGHRDDATPNQFTFSLVAPPRTPDIYGSMQGTNAPQGSWVDLRFDYGNANVKSVVKISTWKPAAGETWQENNSQNWVNEAFLVFTWHPSLGPERELDGRRVPQHLRLARTVWCGPVQRRDHRRAVRRRRDAEREIQALELALARRGARAHGAVQQGTHRRRPDRRQSGREPLRSIVLRQPRAPRPGDRRRRCRSCSASTTSRTSRRTSATRSRTPRPRSSTTPTAPTRT